MQKVEAFQIVLFATHKDTGILYADDSVFCKKTYTIGVKPSRSDDARRVERLFAPLWRVVNDFLRITVADNGDVVPSVDAITLNVMDKKFGIVLPVFKAAPPDGDHLFTAVPTEAIPPVSLEYLERLARIAAEDTPFACGSPPCVLAGRDVPFFFWARGCGGRPWWLSACCASMRSSGWQLAVLMLRFG